MLGQRFMVEVITEEVESGLVECNTMYCNDGEFAQKMAEMLIANGNDNVKSIIITDLLTDEEKVMINPNRRA